MLTIKRHVPKRLSLIHMGLSAKDYVLESAAALRRRIDRFRSQHEYIGRKSVMGTGALLMGFLGSIYILFALQTPSHPEVATPAAAKTGSDTARKTPSATSVSSTSTSPVSGTAAAPVEAGGSAVPSQSPVYGRGAVAPTPSLIANSPATAPSASSAPLATAPVVQPGMGSSVPTTSSPSPTTATPAPSPTPSSPAPTTSGPVTTLQQTVLPQSTQPVVSPVTNTVDKLLP